MKKSLLLPLFSLLLTACGPARPVLHLYNWADYIDPAIIRQFEKENGCRVVVDTFDSNEAMYAKLKAGATGYDLLFPSSYMVALMARQNMLLPLDHTLLPNLQYIDSAFADLSEDETMRHSVPYMMSYTGIAFRRDQIPDLPATWAVFADPRFKGRMTLLNDMRETLGAALKFNGFSLNSTNDQELAHAADTVIEWKRQIAKFENEQYKTGLASGEFMVVHGYSGDILQVAEENEHITFLFPKEGFSVARDDLCIPVGARQIELAHRFINFLHRPDIAARNMEWVAYFCPNTGAYPLVDESLRSNPAIFLPPELMEKAEVMTDLGESISRYTAAWDRVKAAE